MLKLAPLVLRAPRYTRALGSVNPGPKGLRVDVAVYDIDHDFARTAPKERKNKRLPIIINGAGPAGLILAIGLKNANIPFEICETHDLLTRPRRNYPSLLADGLLVPLRKFLGYQTHGSLLQSIAVSPSTVLDTKGNGYLVNTHSLMELLGRDVKVNYGFRLEREGISCLGSVVKTEYVTGKTTNTLEGSLLVGADGNFSAVRETVGIWVWPAITYAAGIFVSRKQYESHFKQHFDRSVDNNTIAHLSGNTRLALTVSTMDPKYVHMSLSFSRLAVSADDYHAFFGFDPHERATPPVDYQFDAMIAQEIENMKPLPPPFAKAYNRYNSNQISQKFYLNAVRRDRSEKIDLSTEIFRQSLSMPAVLIGNAAHSVPEILSPGAINWAMIDAIDLCSMIVQRYDDDQRFSKISRDFSNLKQRSWQTTLFDWERDWLTAHGYDLAYPAIDPTNEWVAWVKIARTSRLMGQDHKSTSESEEYPEGKEKDIKQFARQEAARWEDIQRRSTYRNYKMRNAFGAAPQGTKPSKIVIRHLDLRAHGKEKENENSFQDEGSMFQDRSTYSREDTHTTGPIPHNLVNPSQRKSSASRGQR